MTRTDQPPTGDSDVEHAPFFAVLERLGKQVLRPGGMTATHDLVAALGVGPTEDVVELAAGVGATARHVLGLRPRSYVAVEPDDRFAERLAPILTSAGGRRALGSAQDSGLSPTSADVVLSEALLTMQTDERRRAIVAEAARLLRPGGRYGIHELCTTAETDERRAELQRDLSRATRVNARPSTAEEWRLLLESAGLTVRSARVFPLRLLTLRGLIADEGVLRTLAIASRVVRSPGIRRRVRHTHAVHRRHRDALRAILVVAEKSAEGDVARAEDMSDQVAGARRPAAVRAMHAEDAGR